MVASIPQTTITQPITTKTPAKTTKTSIFYINDVHSNLTNIEKLKTASDEFDSFVPSEKTDKLKFAAGDIGAGRDIKLSKVAVVFQNGIGLMASAGGNHEFDLKKDELAEVLRDSKYKTLGLNVGIPLDSESKKELRKEIINSYIQEQNGIQYGVIGLLPFDFLYHLSDAKEYKDFEIPSVENTIPILQKEVDKMKEQGVNKIIVLSHNGYNVDVKFANSVEGIDVIIGGHTHDLIEGVQEGKNLFYSKKTGEPTIITQVGKDGKYFGVLNLEFNDKGIIVKAQNNVSKTKDFARSSVMEYFADTILGKPEIIGKIKSAPKHDHTLIAENPSINFLLDVERKELGVDISAINAAEIRGSLEKGSLTNRDLQMMSPFNNRLWIINLTEKELVDSLKVSASSFTNEENFPGILQFSGVKYTMSKSGEVKEAFFVDKDGKETPIDINNPNLFKTYRVSTGDFMAQGGCKYFSDKTGMSEKILNIDLNKVVVDYLKKYPEPIDIKSDGRIKIVDS